MRWLVVLLLCPASVTAQVKSGAIVGRVTDVSGAVVVGANVTVANTDTAWKTQLQTNSAGDYLAPYLAPGAYSVEITMAGFASYRATGIALAANETWRIDAVLQVGRVETVADVKADPDPLQTDSSTVQSSADAQAIASIPNINRNPLYYAILQQGVVPRRAMLDTTGPNAFGVGYQSRRQFTAFSVNGGSAFTNEILLDGISIIGSAWNEATVLPNVASLAEVRIIQNNYTAEYGRGQGIVTMYTKSGANRLHGEPQFDWRNNSRPQATFADAMRNIPPGPVRVLNLGFNLGGPVVLPRIYNGRDKLFFFIATERLRHEDSPQWLLKVPTTFERRGDFSRTLIPGDDGQPIPAVVFDPFNVRPAGENLYRRMPFPNGVVPAGSVYAQNIMALYPDPNREADDAFQNGNFYATRPRDVQRQNLTLRMDYYARRHALYAAGSYTSGQLRTRRPFGDDSPVWLAPTHRGLSSELVRDRNWYATAGDSFAVSPRLAVDLRVGVTRVHSDAGSGANRIPFDYDSIGMPRAVQSLVLMPGHSPDILTGTFSGPGRSTYDNKEERQVNQQAAGSATRVAGAWMFKLGGEIRNQLANNTDPYTAAAILESPAGSARTFSAEYVTADGRLSALNTSPQQRGLAAAALFDGAGYWSNPGALRMALSHKYAAAYVQTQWRASSRLTLTLGLRWDWQPAPTERYNRLSGIDFEARNAFGGIGALSFPGTAGYGRGLWDTEWTDWQPRLGFAWRAASSLVVRGGYGLTYLPTNVGYYTSDLAFGSLSFAPRITPRPFGTNPRGIPEGRFWDASLYTRTAGAAPDPASPELYGGGGTFFDRRGTRNGRAHQVNFFLERRIKGNWVLAAGYVGTVGRSLQNSRLPLDGDQLLPPEMLQSWRVEYIRTGGAHNPANDLVPNPFQPVAGPLLPFLGALGNRTLPRRATQFSYPLFMDATLQATNGYSNYHSLEIRLNHSFSSGLLVRAHYTWSKSTDFSNTPLQWGQGFDETRGGQNGDSSHMDLRNPANNTKLSYSDQPQRLILMGAYDLPLRRTEGRRGKLAWRRVLEGWRASGILTLHSGTPVGLGGLDSGSLSGRQNRVPGVPIEVPVELQRWYDGKTTVTLPSGRRITPCAFCFLKYNSDAFTAPYVVNSDGGIVADVYWIGAAAINYSDMRGSGRANLDVRLGRTIPLRGRVSMNFTISATNVIDNVQLQGNYEGNLGSLVTQNAPSRGLLPGYGSNSNFGTQYPVVFDRRQFLVGMGLKF